MGIPVVRPKSVETTSFGAAYVAGVAVGVWKDIPEQDGAIEYTPSVSHSRTLFFPMRFFIRIRFPKQSERNDWQNGAKQFNGHWIGFEKKWKKGMYF